MKQIIIGILNPLVLWYLKKFGICVETHGKTGWQFVINFHKEGNYRLCEYTYEKFEEIEKQKRGGLE